MLLRLEDTEPSIRRTHGRESVRNQNRDLILTRTAEVIEYGGFRCRVHGGSRFIEYQDIGIRAHEGSRQRDLLPLPTRHPDTR